MSQMTFAIILQRAAVVSLAKSGDTNRLRAPSLALKAIYIFFVIVTTADLVA